MRGFSEIKIDAEFLDPPGDETSKTRKAESDAPLYKEFRLLSIDKIVDPHEGETDYDQAYGIAESAAKLGIINPIAVRKVEFERNGKLRHKYEVIAGSNRLCAAQLLGDKFIYCAVVERSDDAFVKQIRLAENLFRKHLTVLQHAEMLTDWVEPHRLKSFWLTLPRKDGDDRAAATRKRRAICRLERR